MIIRPLKEAEAGLVKVDWCRQLVVGGSVLIFTSLSRMSYPIELFCDVLESETTSYQKDNPEL